jgi:hypothetical protein
MIASHGIAAIERRRLKFQPMTLRILPIVTALAICSIVPANGQGNDRANDRANDQANDQANDKRGALRAACQEDYKRLCAGVPPGGGRIKKCMTENSAKLSPACKTALGTAGKSN